MMRRHSPRLGDAVPESENGSGHGGLRGGGRAAAIFGLAPADGFIPPQRPMLLR